MEFIFIYLYRHLTKMNTQKTRILESGLNSRLGVPNKFCQLKKKMYGVCLGYKSTRIIS
jgi:hypothetical protein